VEGYNTGRHYSQEENRLRIEKRIKDVANETKRSLRSTERGMLREIMLLTRKFLRVQQI